MNALETDVDEAAPERGPEAPPNIRRRIAMTRGQGFGVVALLLVPTLALAQLLGDGAATSETRSGGWVLRAETPTSARDGNPIRLRLWLNSTGEGGGAGAKVEVSHAYLDRFVDVVAQPPINSANARAVVLFDERSVVDGLQLSMELTPDRAGFARGHVRVTTDSGEHLELALKTFVFP